MKKILLTLCALVFLPQIANAAVFYVDYEFSGATINGNATTTPYTSIQAFANVARSAGDCAFVRNGRASTTNMSDITFTSDGNLNNPICISGDLDNLWNTFASSSQTATVSFGSRTIEMSASTTGIVAGDWIYVAGDCFERVAPTVVNPCVMSDIINYYKVQSLSGSTITLYKPYRGNQTGAGLTLRNIGKLPQWGVSTSDFQWVPSTDNFWIVAAQDIRSTDSLCAINESVNAGFTFRMIEVTQDGTTSCAIAQRTVTSQFVNFYSFGGIFNNASRGGFTIKDAYIDCNNVASSALLAAVGSSSFQLRASDITMVNCSNDYTIAGSDAGFNYIFKNMRVVKSALTGISGQGWTRAYFQDIFETPNTALTQSNQVSANTVSTTTMATTTNLRTGGARRNLYVYPPSGTANTGLSTRFFPESYIQLFEYNAYSDGTSKTYSMYFASASTSAFTADPTADELYLECEYYNHATNAERIIKKSTGVLDFNGSSSYQALSVTCDPAQAGNVIIRGWYAKPREAPTNEFYMDVGLVVS